MQVVNAYGEKIYHYDVNSLYPTVMVKYPIPIGKMIEFQGDISIFDKDWYGFATCIVTCPEDIEVPILGIPYRNTRIFARGSWKGFYTSLDIQFYSQHGYKFQILRGYTSEKGDLFTSYINKFYSIKKEAGKKLKDHYDKKVILTEDEYAKAKMEYENAKLNINSLYGCFRITLTKTR